MNKYIFFIAIFVGVASNLVHAQINYTLKELSEKVDQLKWNNRTQYDYSNVQGTPYLFEEFINGEVYYDRKIKISPILLRYNLYNDEFEYKDKSLNMTISNPESIDKIVLQGQVFIYVDNKNQAKVSGYVKRWNDQFPAVLTKMKIEFFKKEEPRPYVESKPERFERAHNKHYLMKSEQDIERISSVKKLIKSLGNHKSELTEFAKKEKISSSDPEELAQLLKFYQGLD